MSSTAKHLKHRHYSLEEKRHAARTYAIEGTLTRTSQLLDIPIATIHCWKTETEWWGREIEAFQNEYAEITKANARKVIDLSFRETIDRLEYGDYKVVDKKVQRLPVSGKEAATIGAIWLDKHQILNNQPTSITSNAADARITEFLNKFGQLGDTMKEAQGVTLDNDTGELVDKSG